MANTWPQRAGPGPQGLGSGLRVRAWAQGCGRGPKGRGWGGEGVTGEGWGCQAAALGPAPASYAQARTLGPEPGP